jgi:hypothetical protein
VAHVLGGHRDEHRTLQAQNLCVDDAELRQALLAVAGEEGDQQRPWRWKRRISVPREADGVSSLA